MNYAVILAGGAGKRFGASIPKQFVDVLGKPVIAYTLECFQNHPEIDAIELVCVEGYEVHLQDIVKHYGISKVIKIVMGGAEYDSSILNGVLGLKNIAKTEDVVMIHGAAWPLLPNDIISDNIRVCKEKGNAISASSPVLLYGTNDGECAKHVIRRESFKAFSLPQSFLYGVVSDLYGLIEEKKMFYDIKGAHTIDYMTELGIPIYFSKGNPTNIKITTKEDLLLFQGYLMARAYNDNNQINHSDEWLRTS